MATSSDHTSAIPLEKTSVYSIEALLTGDDGRNARDESHEVFGIAPYW